MIKAFADITEDNTMISRESLKSTDFSDVSDGDKLDPIRPGEVLLDFLEDYEITP